MPSISLRPAPEVRQEAKIIREMLFTEMLSKNAFIFEELNNRMAKAVEVGKLHIEITREELETVPDTKPELFLSYIESMGYTIVPLPNSSFAIYFYNPHEEKA